MERIAWGSLGRWIRGKSHCRGHPERISWEMGGSRTFIA